MMSHESRKIRFGLWYDFRNPAQWRQPADRLYREILDQIACLDGQSACCCIIRTLSKH